MSQWAISSKANADFTRLLYFFSIDLIKLQTVLRDVKLPEASLIGFSAVYRSVRTYAPHHKTDKNKIEEKHQGERSQLIEGLNEFSPFQKLGISQSGCSEVELGRERKKRARKVSAISRFSYFSPKLLFLPPPSWLERRVWQIKILNPWSKGKNAAVIH